MVITKPVLVGIFDGHAQADKAMEEIYRIGVTPEFITYAAGVDNTKSDNIWGAVRNFVSDETHGHERSQRLIDDLMGRGLTGEEARYYNREHEVGKTIIAVKSGADAEMVQTILNSNGAYDYNTHEGHPHTGNPTSSYEPYPNRTKEQEQNMNTQGFEESPGLDEKADYAIPESEGHSIEQE
jgi:hypothetical protein